MLKINVHSRTGFNAEEIEKHKTACSMLETAVNSVEFRNAVLAHDLDNDLGMPNLQIYNLIMTGSEKLSPEKDEEIDVEVEIYYANNRTVGYTYPNIVKTYLNKKFFDQYTYAEVADNLFHEWLHKVGFDHSSATDYNSVPYALGYIVQDLIEQMMTGKVLTPMGAVPRVDSTVDKPVDSSVDKPVPAPKKVACYRSWRSLWTKKVCYMEDA